VPSGQGYQASDLPIACQTLEKEPKCNIFGIVLVVENPMVVACLNSLNQKSEFRSEKYWVAKANENIARGKT
jgi:hypothetical protein